MLRHGPTQFQEIAVYFYNGGSTEGMGKKQRHGCYQAQRRVALVQVIGEPILFTLTMKWAQARSMHIPINYTVIAIQNHFFAANGHIPIDIHIIETHTSFQYELPNNIFSLEKLCT